MKYFFAKVLTICLFWHALLGIDLSIGHASLVVPSVIMKIVALVDKLNCMSQYLCFT